MGYAAKRAQRERVLLDDGYWAVVQKLNLAGQQSARRVLYGQVQLQEGPQRIALGDLALGETTRRLLADNILDWNLDREDGTILDITYESVNGLSMEDQQAILAVIVAGNAELRSLLGLTVAPSAGGAAAADAPPALDSEAFPVGSNGSSPTTPALTDSTPASGERSSIA